VTSGEPVRRAAIVRPPGASFTRALSEHPDRATIDPVRAAAQHAAYREALRRAGLDLVQLPPDEELPDLSEFTKADGGPTCLSLFA